MDSELCFKESSCSSYGLVLSAASNSPVLLPYFLCVKLAASWRYLSDSFEYSLPLLVVVFPSVNPIFPPFSLTFCLPTLSLTPLPFVTLLLHPVLHRWSLPSNLPVQVSPKLPTWIWTHPGKWQRSQPLSCRIGHLINKWEWLSIDSPMKHIWYLW